MKISQVLKEKNPALSFEFFPPKTKESSQALFETIKNLSPLGPAYVSVTYGAGGTTRELTHDLIVKIKKETNLNVVSHLTCVGSTKEQMKEILDRYNQSGIENILALRGDPPRGQEKFQALAGGFNFASELVAFIKKNYPQMGIGVAGFPEGHPECPNRLKEMDYLKEKVDAGADYICTQLFFRNDDFFDFKERCEMAGIKIPIIAGIMPITSRKTMKRMSELALGARFPAKLLRAMARAESDEQACEVGIHWASEQVRDLLDQDCAGVHFYTLNKSLATSRIYQNLGISHSDSLKGQILSSLSLF